jgi:hypothetical protein
MWFVIALVLAGLGLYILYVVFYLRDLDRAIRTLNALPPDAKSQYVIRTDGVFPCVGKRPPTHLHWRTKFGLIMYKDPEMGMCMIETCRVIPEDELFH